MGVGDYSDEIKLSDLTKRQEQIIKLDVKLETFQGVPILISRNTKKKLTKDNYVLKANSWYMILRNGDQVKLEKVIEFLNGLVD